MKEKIGTTKEQERNATVMTMSAYQESQRY